MDESLKKNLLSNALWVRFIYMVIFFVAIKIASIVMFVIICLQFVISLLNGEDNIRLREFGQSLSKYLYHTLNFLTFNTEEKPFPFDDWPTPDTRDDVLEGEVELKEDQP